MSEAEKKPNEDRLPVIVVSHERSGTHFLMNSISSEFDYVSEPWVDFDKKLPQVNFFYSDDISKFFSSYRNSRSENIRKSHHQYSFFQPAINEILGDVHIFYIYRDPRDVMFSFRHFLNSWPWFEGPKVADAGAFIRTPPAGQMLRYQYHQVPDMLDRWRVHVDGWVDAGARHDRITLVKYEDLKADYDSVMDRIASKKGWTRQYGRKPGMGKQTVGASNRGDPSNQYSANDLAYFEQKVGPTMRRLGYEIQSPNSGH